MCLVIKQSESVKLDDDNSPNILVLMGMFQEVTGCIMPTFSHCFISEQVVRNTGQNYLGDIFLLWVISSGCHVTEIIYHN